MAEEHRLDVAHPAACSPLDCPGERPALVGSPAQVLRFTSWVPKTAPLFSMTFLQQHVLPTLDTAASGESAACLTLSRKAQAAGAAVRVTQ